MAVLCNTSTGNPGGLAHNIIDAVAGPLPDAQPKIIELKAAELKKSAGLWRQTKTHLPTRTVFEDGELRVRSRKLNPLGDGLFRFGRGPARWRFEKGPTAN